MRNRFITFLLAICMILSVCGTVAAENSTASAVAVDTKKAELLTYLGIFQDMDETEYSSEMTREDFAYSVAKFMKLSPVSDNRYYIDLRMEGYAFGYINALAENGVLSPSDNDAFRPFENVTSAEACKMIVSAMGYDPVAKARGGYPMGYLRVAKTIGLSIQESESTLTFADGVELLFDALKACTYDVASINADGTVAYTSSDKCYAHTVFNLNWFEGTVSSDHMGSIKNDYVTEEGQIEINGEIYDVQKDGVSLGDITVGDYCEFFVTDENRGKIVYAHKISHEDDLVIDVKNFVGFENNTIRYYKNLKDSKIMTQALDKAVILYNGLPLRSEIRETFNDLNKGTITFKDSDDDGKYDVVSIRDFKNFYVKFIDGGKLYNDLKKEEYVDIESAKALKIIKNSIEVASKEILPEMSLSIAVSKNQSVVEISINDSVTGELSSVYSDKVLIGDKEYSVENSYSDCIADDVTMGQTYAFYIDFNGDVAYAKLQVTRRMTLAYLINITTRDTAFDSSVIIKVVETNNDKKELEINDTVTIDAVKYKKASADTIINVLKNGKSHARQLIQYELNGDGKIVDIDTIVKNPGEDPDYSLSKVFKEVKSRWYHLGRYGFTAICSANTAAFCIPDDGSVDEEKYFVQAGASSLTSSNDCYTTLDCYYTGDNSPYVDAVIGEKDVNTYDPETVIMLDEAYQVLGDDGDIAYKLYGYKQGARMEYFVESDVLGTENIPNFKRGDLIVLSQNQVGEVGLVSKVFDAETKTPIDWEYETDKELLYVDGFKEHYCEELNLSFGYVRKNYGGEIISIGKNANCEISERIYANKNNMLYNAELDKIELIPGTAIVDYETAGEGCMRAVHHMWFEDFRGLYLYN